MSAAKQAPHTRHLTKNAFVYQTLRTAIIRCELQPGERLVIDDLARRYEVSIIPVREALRLLESEGLVVSIPHVGATVAPISRDSVREVFTLLEGLELVASRADLQAMISALRAGGEADVRTLQGWRRELVGDELLALLRGERELAVTDGLRVVIRTT